MEEKFSEIMKFNTTEKKLELDKELIDYEKKKGISLTSSEKRRRIERYQGEIERKLQDYSIENINKSASDNLAEIVNDKLIKFPNKLNDILSYQVCKYMITDVNKASLSRSKKTRKPSKNMNK